MQRLKELLEAAVAASEFDLGRTEVSAGQTVTSYSANPEEMVSPGQLRELLQEARWDQAGTSRPRRAKLVCPSELVSQVGAHLRGLLGEFVDPDTDDIGYAFPSVVTAGMGWSAVREDGLQIDCSISPLDVFAQGVVRAAAVLGIEGITALLSGWLDGDPVKYRTSALLNGIYLREAVTPVEGVHIAPLPLSSDELPSSLPALGGRAATDYLGRTLVSIDCTAAPALFRPSSSTGSPEVQGSLTSNIGINDVCQALSLECASYVDPGDTWGYYLGLEDAFPFSGSSIRLLGSARHSGGVPMNWSLNRDLSTGVTTLIPVEASTVTLQEERLRRLLECFQDPGSRSFRNAISRWTKSMDTRQGLSDRFIDLRIALESLYLPSGSNAELAFRMATSGAWHLGTDFQDRRKIFDTLRKSYDEGSAIVHGRGEGDTARTRTLLSDTQAICRRGILKILEEGSPRDWHDLVLGG